jgi:hypothetical protein
LSGGRAGIGSHARPALPPQRHRHFEQPQPAQGTSLHRRPRGPSWGAAWWRWRDGAASSALRPCGPASPGAGRPSRGCQADQEIARRAGVSREAVTAERWRRGLASPRACGPLAVWSPAALARLGTASDAQVAAELGWPGGT